MKRRDLCRMLGGKNWRAEDTCGVARKKGWRRDGPNGRTKDLAFAVLLRFKKERIPNPLLFVK